MTVFLADGKPVVSKHSLVLKFSINDHVLKQRFQCTPPPKPPPGTRCQFLKKIQRRTQVSRKQTPETVNQIQPPRIHVHIPPNSECTFNAIVISPRRTELAKPASQKAYRRENKAFLIKARHSSHPNL